jgi:AbiV family abortive infection protein
MATRSSQGALTESQIIHLSAAVLANVRDLHSDAILLRDNGRVPRAFALAHLALEELAKAELLFSHAISLTMGKVVDWPRFWLQWQDHTAKMRTAVMVDALRASTTFGPLPATLDGIDGPLVRLPDDLEERIRQYADSLKQYISVPALLHGLRLDATYVDWREGGIITPAAAVTLEATNALIDGTTSGVELTTLLFEALPLLHDPRLAPEMQRVADMFERL